MSKFTFRKATKKRARLKMAIYGGSGSGKTYTSLSVACHLTPGKVAVIDTEKGSASKYAGLFDFDVLELDDFNPKNYIQAIEAAHQAGYETLIIDSLSHAWCGPGGALEMVDAASAKSRGNSFTAWRNVTPLQNQLVQTIISTPVHILATMRAKTEYVVETRNGKAAPKKVGLAPIQRDGMEYEFDVVCSMDQENNLVVEKTRCPDLADKIFHRPNGDLSVILRSWLDDGVQEASSPPGVNTRPGEAPASNSQSKPSSPSYPDTCLSRDYTCPTTKVAYDAGTSFVDIPRVTLTFMRDLVKEKGDDYRADLIQEAIDERTNNKIKPIMDMEWDEVASTLDNDAKDHPLVKDAETRDELVRQLLDKCPKVSDLTPEQCERWTTISNRRWSFNPILEEYFKKQLEAVERELKGRSVAAKSKKPLADIEAELAAAEKGGE